MGASHMKQDTDDYFSDSACNSGVDCGIMLRDIHNNFLLFTGLSQGLLFLESALSLTSHALHCGVVGHYENVNRSWKHSSWVAEAQATDG